MSDSEQAVLRIRPHHGLCIQFFRGEGYSESFTAGMNSVAGRLSRGCEVELTCEADCICAACPNNLGGRCLSGPKVRTYDQRVLALCGLASGQTMAWSEFAGQVRRSVIDSGRLGDVCGDCECAYICHASGLNTNQAVGISDEGCILS